MTITKNSYGYEKTSGDVSMWSWTRRYKIDILIQIMSHGSHNLQNNKKIRKIRSLINFILDYFLPV